MSKQHNKPQKIIETKQNNKSLRYTRYVVAIVLVGIYVVVNKTFFNFFIADYLNTQGKKILYSGDISEASVYATNAVELNPFEPTYRRNKALVYLSATAAPELTPEDIKTLKQRAFEELEAAYSLQPINLVNIKSLIPMYYFVAVKDISNPEAGLDESYRGQVVAFLDLVKDLAPTDADLALTTGKYYKLLQSNKKAKVQLSKALTLRPGLQDAQIELNSIND